MKPQVWEYYLGKYVIVQWRDAACDDNADTEKAWKFNCPPVETVGFVLDQNKNRILLTTHRNRALTKEDLETEAGEQVWYIPWGMVEGVQILKPERDDNAFDESPGKQIG